MDLRALRCRRRCSRPTTRITGRRLDRPRTSAPPRSIDVREFFQTYYHAGNASLSLAGDIETEQAFDLAEKYFGGLPRGPGGGSRPRRRTTRRRARRSLLEDRVELPRLYISWHSPAMFADGDAELDIVADVLAHGKTSRLYKTLVYERRIATDVSAYQQSREMGGMFQVVLHRRDGRRAARN